MENSDKLDAGEEIECSKNISWEPINATGLLDLTDSLVITDYSALLIKVLKAVKPDTVDYWGTDDYAGFFKSCNFGITDEEAELINQIAKDAGVV